MPDSTAAGGATVPSEESVSEASESRDALSEDYVSEDYVSEDYVSEDKVADEQAAPRVRIIGPSLPYADDAEARILDAINSASDCSAGSDELERLIDDWPSRYHLSGARAGLLVPFRLGPDQRVLEVGAGCGAITRHLGETGAQVVAIEGNHTRAQAAAFRCRDLASVEVLGGPLAALEDTQGFDVVVVIGVLEYAGDDAGGGDGAAAFLNQLRSLLRDDGCLILAIENQLGLRYLLGYPEDHLGQPWVGVAGYPGTRGVQTYSRRALTDRLESSGFVRQRWYFPFPDYKLPRLILADAAYDQPDAVAFVDQLVRSPAPRDERDTAPPCEERAAHRTFLEAGLGREVANAFVVCASGHAGDPTRLAPTNGLAWILSQGRARPWRRLKLIEQRATERVVHSTPLWSPMSADKDASNPAPWLRHKARGEQAYAAGVTVEQQVLDACRQGDPRAVTNLLVKWNDFLGQRERPGAPGVDAVHPLLGADTTMRLPQGMADVDLANFVCDATGTLHYIDDEWQAAGGVDGRLARLRALWHLAVDMVTSRILHPWPEHETPVALFRALATATGLTLIDEDLSRLFRAESLMVATVTRGDAQPFREQLATLSRWTGPRSPLEAQLAGVLEGQARASRNYEAEIHNRGEALAALQQRVATQEQALGAAQQERDAQRQRADDASGQMRVIQHSRFWRLWQRLGNLRRRLSGR